MVMLRVTGLLLAQLFSPERPLDAAVLSSGQGSALRHAFAAGSDGALAAWVDNRSGVDEVWMTRLSLTGEARDPGGVQLSSATKGARAVGVACLGTRCLVAWQDGDDGSADVLGRRVELDGTVLDAHDLAIAAGENFQGAPKVVTDGEGFVVVWEDWRDRAAGDIYAARVALTGEVRDSAGVAVASGPQGQHAPAIVFDGQHHLVVWEEGDVQADLFARRLNRDLSPGDVTAVTVSAAEGRQGNAALAFDGTRFLVAWEDDRAQMFVPAVYAARVGTDGTVLDPLGLPIARGTKQHFAVAVAFDGARFTVAWREESTNPPLENVYAMRVDPATGASLDLRPLRLTTERCYGAVWLASVPGGLLASYEVQAASLRTDVTVNLLDRDGGVASPTGERVSRRANTQYAPAITAFAGGFLLAFSDRRAGDDDIYAALLGPLGEVTSVIPVSTAPRGQLFVSVAAGPQSALLAWYDRRDGRSNIYAARLDAAGKVLDPDGLLVSAATTELVPSKSAPVVGWDGEHFVVVWTEVGSPSHIFAARIDLAGHVLDPTPLLVVESLFPAYVNDVAFGGGQYFIVYSRGTGFDASNIVAARLAPDGQVRGLVTVSSAANAQSAASVAWDGARFVVVWADERDQLPGIASDDIYAARVTPDGELLDPEGLRVADDVGAQLEPRVAFDGVDLQVTWSDWSRRAPRQARRSLSRDGVVGPLVHDAPSPEFVSGPRLAWSGGVGVLAYERFAREHLNSQRVFVRVASPGMPPPQVAEPMVKHGCGCSSAQSGLIAALALAVCVRRRRKCDFA